MSELKHYNINGVDFDFYCESYKTRNGFAHKCDMFENDHYMNDNKVNYLNRTWECYSFQTCMLGAIENEINYRKDSIKSNFFAENNYAKMTPKRKVEFDNLVDSDKNIATYRELKKFLSTYDCEHMSYKEWMDKASK